MRSENPFEVLELDLTATQAQVKAAYRRLVRLYHPDNNPGFPQEAAAKLRELRDAQDLALGGWKPGTPGVVVEPAAGAAAPVPMPTPAPAPAFASTRRGRKGRRAAQTYQRPWQPPPVQRHENPPRRMDPPTVPPKSAGPQPPEPKYAHVPPARPVAAVRADRPVDVAALAARRSLLIDDLVAVGFVGHADEVALDHAIVDAFLPVLADGDRVRVAARYSGLAAAGQPPAVRHHEVFLHAVPTIGGDDVREQAVAALARAHLVACTDDRLLWTVSRLAEADGLLLQERVDVHAEAFSAIDRASLMQGGIGLGFTAGLAVRFALDEGSATRLVAAVEQAGEAGAGAGR